MNILILWFVLLGLAGAPTASAAQTEVPITLEEAVREALEGNRALAAAAARTQAAELGARAQSGFLLPSVQATAGALRTNDPVGVFGTKLRQRSFAAADFDIPALNDPAAVTDWTAGLGARWELAQLDRWVERKAAQAEGRAARAGQERTREATVYRTRLLYVGAVRAESTLEALQAAEASADATLARVSRRVEEGQGTDADRLQAEAALSSIRAGVERARAAVVNARESLASHLGWGPDRLPVPTDGADVLDGTTGADAGERAAVRARADLEAGRAGVEAAEARADALRAQRLPKLEAFGQISTHAPGIADGREWNWSAGVQLSLPLFTGFSLTRGAEAARAQARALSLDQMQRETEAEAEVRAALRNVGAARAALESARAAADAADEAARLLLRRYEEGMATVADLLQAEARAAELDTGVAAAEAELGAALATLAFVEGRSVPTRS